MARHTRTPIRAGERSCRTSIMDTTKGRAWFVGRSVAKGNWVASVVQPRDLVAQWNAGQGAMLYSKMEPATLHYTKNIICHVCGSAEISFAIPSGSEPTCLFRSCSDCASTNIFAHAADSVAPCRTQRTCRTFLGKACCRLNVRMRHGRGLASSLAHLSTHFRPMVWQKQPQKQQPRAKVQVARCGVCVDCFSPSWSTRRHRRARAHSRYSCDPSIRSPGAPGPRPQALTVVG